MGLLALFASVTLSLSDGPYAHSFCPDPRRPMQNMQDALSCGRRQSCVQRRVGIAELATAASAAFRSSHL